MMGERIMEKAHADSTRFWKEAIPFLTQFSQQDDLDDVIDVSRSDQPAYLISSPKLTEMVLGRVWQKTSVVC
jgi:hypothetical protein